MYLDAKEERMLAGKEGIGKKKAMELLCAVGEAMGAKRMAKLVLAHILPPDVMFFPYDKRGRWGQQMSDDWLQEVDHFEVPTTIEPKWIDLDAAKELEFPPSVIEDMTNIMEPAIKRYIELGAAPTFTAITFYTHPVAFGQHVAVAESCAIPYYAGIYGARCDRDNSATTIACAITGVTPEFGAHLPENRFGEVVVRIKDDLKLERLNYVYYDAMSYYATKQIKGRIPIFANLPKPLTMTQAKYIVSPLGVGAGVPMMHIVGVTPEAPTMEAATGGKKPLYEVEVGKREVEGVFETLRTATTDKVDWVVFGCPHVSVEEMRQMAQILQGKQVNKSTKLIVSTYRPFFNCAEEMGYVDIIKKAGGMVICDSCIAFSGSMLRGTMATNSAKAAYFLHGYSKGEIKLLYGSLADCINSAITGRWQV
jgi:hypothetical protein